MIGFYDYTVVLTYCSIISAIVGIVLSLGATAHPQWAVLLLLLSGLCDAFDGNVARTKKNRTKAMQNFGIQIDSLADIVAFGILPVCIGLALWNHSATHAEAGSFVLPHSVPILISCLYILAAVVRLAYFNVTEEERQSTGASKREFYTGLPVTSASLIFPTLVLLQRITRADLCWLYHAVMLATAGAFVGKFHVKKPNLRGILILVALGAAEFLLFLLLRLVTRHG